MSRETRRWVLARRPQGVVQPDDFRLETVRLGALQPGQVHVRSVAFGNAPAMREWMDEHSEGTAPSILVGQPLRGGGVAVVVQSAHSELRDGDMVTGLMDWCEEAIIDPHQVWPRDAKAWAGARKYRRLDRGSDPGMALGVLGGNGLAAFFGVMDVARPKAGETVVVSAAAGSVGSIAGQIARICGARVIGIAGGQGKIRQLVDDLGFDAAIDRSAPDFPVRLREACPEGINVYFDNVQGEVLDACLEHLAKGGRVAMCGGVSVLNENGGRASYNLMRVVWKRAQLQGFSVFEYPEQKRHEALEQLGQWIRQGRLRIIQEHRRGFDQLPEAFIDLLAGRSSGSQVVWIDGLN